MQGLRNSVTMVCSLQTSLPSLLLDVNRHRSCPHPLRKFPVKLSQMLQQAVKNKTSLRGGGCKHHIIYCVTEGSVENPMATCTSFCTSQHRRFSIIMWLLRSNSRTTSTVQRCLILCGGFVGYTSIIFPHLTGRLCFTPPARELPKGNFALPLTSSEYFCILHLSLFWFFLLSPPPNLSLE